LPNCRSFAYFLPNSTNGFCAEKFRYYNLNGPQKIIFDNFKLHKNDDGKFLMTKRELRNYLDELDICDDQEAIETMSPGLTRKYLKKQTEWVMENLIVKHIKKNTENFYVFKEREAASGFYKNNGKETPWTFYHPKKKKDGKQGVYVGIEFIGEKKKSSSDEEDATPEFGDYSSSDEE
jgi:hypothetical protein